MNISTLFRSGLLIVVFTALYGCGSSPKLPPLVTEVDYRATDAKANPYLIQPGDELELKFFYNPELNEKALVRSDGHITVQLLDEVKAAGLTPAELDDILTKAYSRELREPSVTVIIRKPNKELRQIYVGGEVKRPGLVNFIPQMSTLEAVIRAEGFLSTAKLEEVIVIRKGAGNRPVPHRIDLNNALYGQGPGVGFALQPQDIIYVPKTKIAKANQFVKQYIEDLLLYRGVSFGISYNFGDNNNN